MKTEEIVRLGLIAQEVEVKFPAFDKAKPYVEPTDKEIIEGLEEGDNYEAAYLIRHLKKDVANLKRKLTILQKKYDGKTK